MERNANKEIRKNSSANNRQRWNYNGNEAMISTAFVCSAAAGEWIQLASMGVSSRIADIHDGMADLLPYARGAVSKINCRTLLKNHLLTAGYYIYCLISPLMAKLYIGAVGFNGPREPRLREHVNLAKVWGSRLSRQRFHYLIPDLYSIPQ